MIVFRSRAHRIAAGVLGALLLAGNAVLPARAADPYKINVILPMTGSAAFIGKEEAAALGLVEKTVNKSGGISGRPIKFAIQDDQTNPQVALQLANGIIAQKVPIMIGSSITSACAAIAPLMKDGPVDVCLSPGLHPTEGSYIFLPLASSYDLGVVSARYFREHNKKNVAFIFSTDGSGQDGELMVNRALALPENKDVKVVDVEHFGVTDLSVSAQVAKIKSSGAQAVYVWTTGTPLGTVLRAISDAGLDIPVVASFSNMTYDQMKAYKGFLPKELLFAALPTQANDLIAKASPKDPAGIYYRAFRDEGIRPDVGYAIAWDPAMLVVSVLKATGLNASPEKVRDYLANLRGWKGANGTYDFRAIPQRGVNDNSIVMVRWDALQDTWVSARR